MRQRTSLYCFVMRNCETKTSRNTLQQTNQWQGTKNIGTKHKRIDTNTQTGRPIQNMGAKMVNKRDPNSRARAHIGQQSWRQRKPLKTNTRKSQGSKRDKRRDLMLGDKWEDRTVNQKAQGGGFTKPTKVKRQMLGRNKLKDMVFKIVFSPLSMQIEKNMCSCGTTWVGHSFITVYGLQTDIFKVINKAPCGFWTHVNPVRTDFNRWWHWCNISPTCFHCCVRCVRANLFSEPLFVCSHWTFIAYSHKSPF